MHVFLFATLGDFLNLPGDALMHNSLNLAVIIVTFIIVLASVAFYRVICKYPKVYWHFHLLAFKMTFGGDTIDIPM